MIVLKFDRVKNFDARNFDEQNFDKLIVGLIAETLREKVSK